MEDIDSSADAQGTQEEIDLPAGATQDQNSYMLNLLRSEQHAQVSSGILAITFVGRVSGQRYSVPVAYWSDDDVLVSFTKSRWWRNLVGGAEVVLDLKGQQVAGYAEAITDSAAVVVGLHRMVEIDAENGQHFGVGLDADGKPDASDLRRAAGFTAMMRMRPH